MRKLCKPNEKREHRKPCTDPRSEPVQLPQDLGGGDSGEQKPSAGKATKAETQKRVDEVLQLRLHGAEMPDLVQHSAEKGWNIGDRQLRKYVAKADALMVEILNRNRDQLLGRHIMQRRAILARCMKINDYKTALAAVKDEAQLEDLYPTTRKPTGPDGTTINVNTAIVTQRLAEAAEVYRAVQAGLRGEPYIPPDDMRAGDNQSEGHSTDRDALLAKIQGLPQEARDELLKRLANGEASTEADRPPTLEQSPYLAATGIPASSPDTRPEPPPTERESTLASIVKYWGRPD